MFKTVERGQTINVAGYELICFPREDGSVDVVAKDLIFSYEQFGKKNNNLAESLVLKKLQEEFLPKIAEAVGEKNILEFETDLRTLDGLRPYQNLVSKVSLPTLDFYRDNVDVFDEHKVNSWWWLATPDTAQPHYDPIWVRCVSPRGGIFNGNCHLNNGVRPFLRFSSFIFVSDEG
ncbi:MAG: hypothetical protein IKU60_03855 [Clostridia bacterium]|nr:hypothetical protein [Clostridia bacterium]